ncbi:MAG: glycoside hydrolase family 76 protein, partial [Armatimonadota bacterium]|nr:glycoside hydrolase family 76 protein [Armatimonadota bacterium]
MKLRFAPILLLIALGLTSLSAPARANYRQKAEEATDFIQAHFYDASAKRYRAAYPADPKALPYDFMWANGVQFPVLAAAVRYDPVKYKPLLLDFFDGLQTYWDPKGNPPGFNAWCSGPGGTDKYYDDNAWMVLDFAAAYQNTGDARFLKAAQDTQNFVLSGWDDKLGGGLYWKLDHQSKNTCVTAPAAAAALRLVQVGKIQDQKAWAVRLRDWTNKTLQDKDGLYWDNINLDGKIQTAKWTYNTGLMIRTDVLFYELDHSPADLREARRVADAA